jgi:signal transduction histidine kinase
MPAKTKDDQDLRVELSLSELRNARGERFALAVVRDAMHRKRLELTNLELVQARVARSEAETELAARDDLIDALASALSADPSTEEIASTAAALAEYRSVQGGELSFRLVDGELVDIVHAAVDAARHQAGRRHLLVFTPPSVPATFDAARTRQLLGYLLADLIEASPDGGRIEIHLDQPTPQVAQMRVRAPAGGTGLGVQVARALAQRQKGTLSLNKVPSGGVDAVLTLPGRPLSARRKPGRIRPRRERLSVP